MVTSPILFLALALPVAGALAGFLAGLLGIGGGVVLVPVLYFGLSALGYAPDEVMHVAVGTSLAVIVLTSFSSARAHWRRGAVDETLLKNHGPGIVTGALAGAVIAAIISGAALKTIFGISIAFLALLMVIDPARFTLRQTVPGQPWSSGAGGLIGALSSLMGIGGAVISVPYMSLCNVPIHRAVATASVFGLLIAVPGALGFAVIGWEAAGRPPLSLGYINIPAWALIVPFSYFAAPWGARAAHALPVKGLRRLFALFLVIVAGRMIFDV